MTYSAVLLGVTVACMIALTFEQTGFDLALVYAGAAILYTGLLLNALH